MKCARKILLKGAVQGCGLRPALARLALQNNWSGTVRNTTAGVELIVQGSLPADDQLRVLIGQVLPDEATISGWFGESIQSSLSGRFQIVESNTAGVDFAQWPHDLAICQKCLDESRDLKNRRFGYPFTTCAQCGPRYSILLSMPFDRERTTMRVFEMCRQCAREYDDPTDRRFHAQTISCPQCGPRIWASDGKTIQQQHVLASAAKALCDCGIVALRGIGGYQLLADATSSTAVCNLRQRKQRCAKPLAVLVGSLCDAERIARICDAERAQLCSAANPIVLLKQRDYSQVAPEVNPGLTDIGILLPTTALHAMLLDLVQRPLVCTSGNIEGQPLAYQVAEAETSLRGIVDVFIHHDREIEQPIDDSVARIIAGRPVTIRAARGITPLPLNIPYMRRDRAVLACGGQQKNAIAFSNGAQAYLAPHIGDLDTVAAQARWKDQLQQICKLPVAIQACDAHPGYFATRWALQQLQVTNSLWHHHAHVVSGMAEHGWLDRQVLGIAWDGTGLGPDGTVWGGEFLLATRSRFQRIAHLRPFSLPGGETAIKDLRRTGVAILSQLEELSAADIASLVQLDVADVRRTQQILHSPFSPVTTSCGRLFDAVALLILNHTTADFEGHAAMCLEAACDVAEVNSYRFDISSTNPRELDWRPVVRQILRDLSRHDSSSSMAKRFHCGLANGVLEIVKDFPDTPVVLTGGVFQNRVLVEMIVDKWPANGPSLGLPGRIPPNDGGLAAGQLAIAMNDSVSQV